MKIKRLLSLVLVMAMVFTSNFGMALPGAHVHASDAVEGANRYLWNCGENGLESVVETPFAENTLQKEDGSISNGVFNKTYYKLAQSINLSSDVEWSIEWSASGSGDAMILSALNKNSKGNVFVYRNSKSLISIGFYDGTNHNYGLMLSDYDIDYTEEHKYCIKNVIDVDGTNMPTLYVDDEEIGPMTEYYTGSTYQDSGDTYLSGKDFKFSYIGNSTKPLSDVTIEYLKIDEDINAEITHIHKYAEWVTVNLPSIAGPGIEKRTCECGHAQTREVQGVWQKHALGSHIQLLPEKVCQGVNLWSVLQHDEQYFSGSSKWTDGGTVCSITIPVAEGEKIFATSFGEAGSNGGTKNGIVVTFFDNYGVLKSLTAEDTYAEFSANGYLTAPAGSVAVCIPMWNDSPDFKVNFPGLEHNFVTEEKKPTCTEPGSISKACVCGEKTVDDEIPALGHRFTNYVSNDDATSTADGTKSAVCDNGCGKKDTVADPGTKLPENMIVMKYDDHMDVKGKKVEIVNAGKPTSYQVGYGVKEGTRDTAVLELQGDYLVATGTGTAQIKIDGKAYDVKVTAAPISLLLLIGQSNMQGSEGNAKQSIVCEEGRVYATYGDRYKMTVSNATNYATSALTGKYSGINVNGTTTDLSGYPIYSLNEAGEGKAGPDSGYAYEWTKQTNEKVWVVNAAHGGSSINTWQPGGQNYEEAIALFGACQDTLQKEIAAGHFKLSHMGYFWCQGCTDELETAEWYVSKFLNMHENLQQVLAFDHDSNPNTKPVDFEFADITLTLAGHEGNTGYRYGGYDTPAESYFMSYEELEMRGQRVAQYWMASNPELEDINLVCNLGDSWVTLPDGSDSVEEYFASHYENGTVDYTVQTKQSESWYSPKTPADVKDSIHYNQIGYNEVGREAARNALYLLGEVPEPEVETTVKFYNWTGYETVTEAGSFMDGCSDTLVVPVVYPCYKSKQVSYEVSEGLKYNYYDLIDVSGKGGTLKANINGSPVVTVKDVEYNYLWENNGSGLESIKDDVFTANELKNLSGVVSGGVFTGAYYSMSKAVSLKHSKEWSIEWTMSGAGSGMFLSTQQDNVEGNFYLYRNANSLIGIGYKEGNKAHNYGVLLSDHNIDYTDEHTYRIQNVVTDSGNMLYLYVDGEEIGPMTNYYVGSKLQNSDNTYLNGKDFVFKYIGNSNYPLNNISMGMLKISTNSMGEDIHAHSYTGWEVISLPSAEGPGMQRRSCTTCDYVQEKVVQGSWQKYDLAKHFQALPENVCQKTNIWSILAYDKEYFTSGGKWNDNVCSLTIPVKGGDQVYATSFGSAGTNGGTKNGIVVTFFDSYGIAKSLSAEETYAEFIINGYLTAPEGTIAVNIPMWSYSPEGEIYITNLEHKYTPVFTAPTCTEEGYTANTCAGCGDATVIDRVAPLGHCVLPVKEKPATCERDGYKAHYGCECGAIYSDKAGKKEIDKEDIIIPATGVHKYETFKVAPTCTEEGYTMYSCECGATEKKKIVKARGHKLVVKNEATATCKQEGYSGDKYCVSCGALVEEGKVIPITHDYTTVVTAPTCTKEGYTTYTCACGNVEVKDKVQATGHAWDKGVIKKEATAAAPGEKLYTCKVCKETKVEEITYNGTVVRRINGSTRITTSLAIADELKATLKVSKFENVIVASATNFPDALSGSYLAKVKNAPILLVDNKNANIKAVQDYIKANLDKEGTVYILGGKNAVSTAMETGLKEYSVNRLAGADRYETNVFILQEAGVKSGTEILVSTGANFADSLSASATGLPILLVNSNSNKLTTSQQIFLKENTSCNYTVLGGIKAVSTSLKDQLEKYDANGRVERVGGDSRYETSVLIAERYVKNAETAIIAYAWNYPDGLCGGVLAYNMNAPLILTGAKNVSNVAVEKAEANEAMIYVKNLKIDTGFALGGKAVLSDNTVKYVFGLTEKEMIVGTK